MRGIPPVDTISQTQSLTAREGHPLSESGNGHDAIKPLGLSTGDDGGRGLLGAPAAEPTTRLDQMTDKAWAVAFTINVAITFLAAVFFFPSALTVLGPIWKTGVWGTWDSLPWVHINCLLVATSVLTASFGLLFLSRYTTPLQVFMGVYMLVLTVALCRLPYPVLRPVAAILPFVCAAISYCVLCLHGVHLSTASIKVASLAITSTPRIASWVICATLFRYLWLAVGIVAYVGSMVAFTTAPASPDSSTTYGTVDCKGPWVITALSCECSGNWVPECKHCNNSSSRILLMVFWAASISWSSDVGANVVAATVADSVASRWSSTDNDVTAWQSCRRLTHSSLGSLCKLAAIDCLSRPMRFVVVRFSNAFWVADALMLYVRFAVSYVLLQPLFCISIYRTSFAEGVRRAEAMYRAHGGDIFFNDARVIAVLYFLCVIFSALPSLALFLCVSVGSMWSASPSLRVTDVVFVFTVAAIFATLEVLMFAFKAVFVCLLQDPESLAEDRDRSPRNDLYKAWRKLQLSRPEMSEMHGEIEL